MRTRTAVIVCASAIALAFGHAAAGSVLTAPPSTPDPAQRYVFYLHGKIVEEAGRNARNPRWGAYEYDAILERLGGRGAIVISELRPRGTDVERYADKLVTHVQALLEAGVPAAHVAIVGFSKGGDIASRAAERIDADVRYVILAGCFDDSGPTRRMHGRVLSLRERSDHLARTCAPRFDPARAKTGDQKEIVLDIGGEHGAFYRPDPRWVEPVMAWIAD
jgi:alpha-beta hydrolase superfamily lysophospholipase